MIDLDPAKLEHSYLVSLFKVAVDTALLSNQFANSLIEYYLSTRR